MSRTERLKLVDAADPKLSIARQCRLLKVARSTHYYRPQGVGDDDLALMRRMDELYLKWPFYGARRLVAELRGEGFEVGRKRVRRLMRLMGLEVNLSKTQHQRQAAGPRHLSVFIAESGDRAPQPGLVRRHHLHPDGQGVRLSGGHHGLA
jgi:putative transposase